MGIHADTLTYGRSVSLERSQSMSKNKATLVRTSRSRWLLISTLFLPLLAYAQEKPLPNKFQIQVGEFFVTRAQTTVSLAATSGVFAAGTILNFEAEHW